MHRSPAALLVVLDLLVELAQTHEIFTSLVEPLQADERALRVGRVNAVATFHQSVYLDCVFFFDQIAIDGPHYLFSLFSLLQQPNQFVLVFGLGSVSLPGPDLFPQRFLRDL